MTNQVDLIVSESDEFTEDLIKRLTLEVTARLKENTPRDTGWARSNWVPNLDFPITEPAGSREAVEFSFQSNATARVLSDYRLPRLVFISNNVPYITDLNEGSSRQAPSGFVQIEINSAVREVS